jgi:predicted acylesterase/phospholipase RssA
MFKRNTTERHVQKMESSRNYEQWSNAAQAYDHASGNDDWRDFEPTESYDYRSIRSQLDKIRDLRHRRDNEKLLYLLNEGLHGNMGGIGKPELYNKAKFGTKRLIHQYIKEICHALNDINEADESSISLDIKHEFFSRASHCVGRSALMLGGGGMMGYFHAGVIKAMIEEDVLPEVIAGSSIGALLGAVVCTHDDKYLLERLTLKNLAIDLESSAELQKKTFNPLRDPNDIDAENFVAFIEKTIPDLTFQEAYELTGRKFNVTVSGLSPKQPPRLLNAITAPNVYIRKAVQASCAVYGIYPPVTLEAKNSYGERIPYLPSHQWIDGSFLDDLPAKRLARLYGVNHFIASIINPIFMMSGFTPDAKTGFWRSTLLAQTRIWKNVTSETLRLTHDYLRVKSPVVNMGLFLAYSLLNQEHTADLNISPKRRLSNPMKLLTAPSKDDIAGLVHEGELCAWERIEMMRNCTSISRTLDKVLHEHGWEETYDKK